MKVIFFQAVKHILVGAMATLFDLTLFTVLALVANPIIVKAISFLFATAIKYWGNKYWAFQKPEREDWHKELFNFTIITLVGLLIDVGVFYYFTNMLGPHFGLSVALWTKVSVVMAAVAAALWNFSGYKFLVFKK